MVLHDVVNPAGIPQTSAGLDTSDLCSQFDNATVLLTVPNSHLSVEMLQSPYSAAGVAGVSIAARELLLAIHHLAVVGSPILGQVVDQGAIQIAGAAVVTDLEVQVCESGSRVDHLSVS
jgi:hypothetical protein